jgi:hypothetical protein
MEGRMLGVMTERERINEDRRKRGEPPLTRGEYRHLKAVHAGSNNAPESFHQFAVTFGAEARASG